MPRIFLPPERLGGATAKIEGEAFRHLVKVLRLAPGAGLQVFDGTGAEIEARVLSVGKRSAELALGARRALSTPAAWLTLLQALPRSHRMDLIVQKATELGVGRIVPVLASRSQVRPPADRKRRWQIIAREAARQSGRADVPEVGEPVRLAAALEDARLPPARFVLWEAERERGLRAAIGSARDVAMLVGPEGGLAPEEIAAARAAGFVAVSLGSRILRVETAAIVALALAAAASGELG